jgi:NADPH:quinone reductase-like Zn-dependent oxidoreductase
MQAIVGTEYGSPDCLELREIDRPVAGEGEVLVRVRAASVNPLDFHVMRGTPYLVRATEGLRRPKVPVRGVDAAGIVEEVGAGVTHVEPGDEVFGSHAGAFAEYVCGRTFVRKPAGITFEQAAAIPVAGCTALQALRDKGRLASGQKVLVNGAAGGVGTFATQIAKGLGAEVTGVCGTRNVELVRSLGADHVVDYTQADYTRSGARYDVILDAAGTHSLSANRRVLTPEGTVVLVGAVHFGNWAGPLVAPVKAIVLSRFSRQTFAPLLAKIVREDLEQLAGLADAGTLVPVIDRTYPLRETADALRYLEEGHARGKVVVVP